MRKHITFLLSIFILLQVLYVNLLAQTSKTSQDDTTKVSTKKSRIELPDVLIYGEDRSKRQSGKKLNPLESDSKIIAPPSIYQPTLQPVDNQKHLFRSKSSELSSRKMIQLNFGKFQQLEASAGWWQETDKLNFGLHGGYSKSDGQFENSQFVLGRVKGQLAGHLTEELSLKSNGSYQYFDYGLYGAETNKLERKNTGSDFNINGTWSSINNFSTEFGLNVQNNNFEDSDSTNNSIDFNDSEYSLTAQFNTRYRATHISVKALYYYNSFENKAQNISTTQNLFKINPQVTFSWKKILNFRTGLVVQNIDIPDFVSETIFSPDIKVIFTPNQYLGFEFKLSSGYESITYMKSWNKNPFISSEFAMLPFKKRFELQFGGEYRLASNINLKSGLTRTDWEYYAYWSRDNQSGLFHLNRLNDIVLFSWNFLSEINLSNALFFKAGITLTIDSIEKDTSSVDKKNVPYLEPISIPMRFIYKIDNTAEAVINFDWTGPRKISLTEDDELPGYGLLSFRLQKQVFKNYSLFFNCQNILNQEYELWENYPGRGIYFEAGIRGNW